MINQILDFIDQYYHVFIIVILFMAFIVSLFRKGSSKSDFIRVFEMVNKAEKMFPEPGTGAIKLSYVINQLKDLDPYFVIKTVDEVLTSPEKK